MQGSLGTWYRLGHLWCWQLTSEEGLEQEEHRGCSSMSSFSLTKICEEVSGLKNQESALSSSLLRKFALGILLFTLDIEGVCASSN